MASSRALGEVSSQLESAWNNIPAFPHPL